MTELDNFTIRKNIDNLTAEELANLRRAYREVMKLKDNRGFEHFAGLHGIPNWWCWHHQRNRDGWSALRLFLPWHRAYLYEFEKALQDIVPGVTIPYWDWRYTRKIPEAFSTPKINGEKNPLYSFHMNLNTAQGPVNRETRRFPGDPADLPTEQEVTYKLDDPTLHFDKFSDRLEDLHDKVHGWVGGSGIENGVLVGGDMGNVGLAAYDPIFWSHHCMIDMLWWKWQKRNGINEIPEQYRTAALAPFERTVDDVLEMLDLGYDYAELSTSVEGNWVING